MSSVSDKEHDRGPRHILARYPIDTIEPITHGLLNQTYVVATDKKQRFILQRVNPIFSRHIHADIEVVTRTLETKGIATPHLVRDREDSLYVVDDANAVWRLMTYVDGVTHVRLHEPATARSAGTLLGRFHAALSDLQHPFSNARLGVHDTAAHLRRLNEALEKHRAPKHPRYDQVAPIAEDILKMASDAPKLPGLPDRAVHGDPKISNILFDGDTGAAICLVDLDTLGRMPVPIELGDAFRSWCNPRGEDARDVDFSLDLFSAAISGYATCATIAREEQTSIVTATLTITLELAARFAADALNESYFGWDATRFGSRSEHNLVRAIGQLELARALWRRFDDAEATVEAAFRDANPTP